MDLAKAAAERTAAWVKDNPKQSIAIAGPLLVSVAPAVIIAPVLGTLGFTAGGVAAGSIAAGIQSGIGNVAAGSLFAFIQSAAAGGAAAGTVAAAGGVTAGASAGYSLAKDGLKWFRK